MIWSVIQQFGAQATKYVVFFILASLLTPGDFGVVGIAAVWIAFEAVFAELGFGAALIQRSVLKPEHSSSTFYVNVGIGVLLSIVGILLSWPVARFYQAPQVQPVLAVLSLQFAINSLSLTQVALAQRELRFRALAVRDINAAAIGGVMGILLATSGYGVWSLVAQSLSTSTIGTLLLWRLSSWRPQWNEVSWRALRELWDYSYKMFLFSIFKYLAQNSDRLLISYFLGASALGLYTFAYKVVVYPVSIAVGAIGLYLFPKFSRMQRNFVSVQTNYLLIVKATNAIVLPVMAITAALAPVLTPLVFGPEWAEAVPLMQIFAVLALAISFISPLGQLMKALGHPGWLLNWSVGITLIIVPSMWWGSQWGLPGVGMALTAAHLIGLPIHYLILTRLVSIDIRAFGRQLFPALAATLVLGGSLWLMSAARLSPAYLQAAALLVVSGVSYVLTLLWLDKGFILTMFKTLVQRDVLVQ